MAVVQSYTVNYVLGLLHEPPASPDEMNAVEGFWQDYEGMEGRSTDCPFNADGFPDYSHFTMAEAVFEASFLMAVQDLILVRHEAEAGHQICVDISISNFVGNLFKLAEIATLTRAPHDMN